MDFHELESYLNELSPEEKMFKSLMELNDIKKLEEEVIKFYSINNTDTEWVINNQKLVTENESFALHKHDRFVSFKKHKHDYIELIYVLSGEIKQKINESEVNIKAGEICLLDLNVFHSIEAAHENDIAVNIIMKKQFFDGIFMSFLSDNDIISDFIIKAFYEKKDSNNYLMFHCRENETIQLVVKKIFCEYFDMKIGSDTAIHAYILLLFTELLRDYKKNIGQSTLQSLNRTIVSEVKNYLSDNYKTADLKETAEHFHFNPDYLSKLIKNSTGISFIDLLQEIRLREACLLLENTNLPVSQVTYEAGYTNISYFYKLFKRKYGVTPVQYKKSDK